MKLKKTRTLAEGNEVAPREAPKGPDAPGFLVRLVGKSRAKRLCRGRQMQPRRD
jgi:hypothetical protein